MNITSFPTRILSVIFMGALMVFMSSMAQAHCDSVDGPVVADAQKALDTGNVEPVLKWVLAEDESKVRRVFDMTTAVRKESNAAREVADRFFFETVVRVHRASEGEGFTGLLPAGSTDPAIAAADKALVSGDVQALADKVSAGVRDAILERFATAHKLRQTADDSVEQGREYVEAYVQFTHFVEGVEHLLSHGASHTHQPEGHEH